MGCILPSRVMEREPRNFCRPYRARKFFGTVNPGRCPGLLSVGLAALLNHGASAVEQLRHLALNPSPRSRRRGRNVLRSLRSFAAIWFRVVRVFAVHLGCGVQVEPSTFRAAAFVRPGRRSRFPGRAGWRRCGFRRRAFQKHCPDVSSRFFPPCSTTRRHRHCFCPGRPTVKLPLRAA